MILPRISIAAMMDLVVLVAVGLATLENTFEWWASATFTLTVLILCLATIGAFSLASAKRPSRVPFAVFGWAYLAFTFGPSSRPLALTFPPLLPTTLVTGALSRIESRIAGPPPPSTGLRSARIRRRRGSIPMDS